MNVERVERLKRIVFLLLIISVESGLMSGCAALGGADVKSDEYIAERALQRWNALIDGDFKKAYEFESPGYRKSKSLDYYRKQFGGWVAWTGARVMHVKRLSDQLAEVRIHLEFDSYQSQTQSMQKDASYFNEKWIYTDDNWWYVSN